MADLEELLFRGESETLDFKRDQYLFVKAVDQAKAKLLKDILAMANAWRATPAFILIGVDAPLGTKPTVVGITDHIDDASIQEFVNIKTNKPVTFNYYQAAIEGKSVGVLEIPVQNRPIYLRHDFGGLRANIVYVRRSSCTAEASPDEIIRMGKVASLSGGDLKVDFDDVYNRKNLGRQHKIECIALMVKEEDDLPDFEIERSSPFDLVAGLDRPNRHYWRELVEYFKNQGLLRKLALTIANTGSLSAHKIRVEFTIEDPNRKWEFCDPFDFEERPPEKRDRGYNMDKIRPVTIVRRPSCDIEYTGGHWHLGFDFNDLQPQRSLSSGVEFYVGCRSSETLSLRGRIFADELPSGGECELIVVADTKTVVTDLDAIERSINLESEADES